jgi:hypothetical protein
MTDQSDYGDRVELDALVKSLNQDVKTLAKSIPDVYISRREHERITTRIRQGFAGLVLLLIIAGLIGWSIRERDTAAAEDRERLRVERQEDLATATELSEDAIVRNTCALKAIFESAQSSATRNPIPPGLDPETQAFVERSRAQAAEFYSKTLGDLQSTLTQLGRDSCPVTPIPSAASG